MLQNRNFPVQRYVCISSRGPLPPLDLELYSRASQVQFECMTRIVSMQCEALYLRDCDLAAMRSAAGSQRERSAKIKLKIKKTDFEN